MPAVGVWQAGERRIGWRSQPQLLSLPSRPFQPVVCRPDINISHFSLIKKQGLGPGMGGPEPLSAIHCRIVRSGTLIAYPPSLLRKHCWEIFRSSCAHQQCLKTCQFNSCVRLGLRWKDASGSMRLTPKQEPFFTAAAADDVNWLALKCAVPALV